jgi:hypothetical protein
MMIKILMKKLKRGVWIIFLEKWKKLCKKETLLLTLMNTRLTLKKYEHIIWWNRIQSNFNENEKEYNN